MTITTVKYPTPVTVNGYSCKDCNEVDLAARHIDPAHPQSGVDNVNAANDPTRPLATRLKLEDAKQKAAEAMSANTLYSARATTHGTADSGLMIDIRA